MANTKKCYTFKVITDQDYFNLVPVGDFHVGHKCFDRARFDLFVERVESMKKEGTVGLVLMGDSIENAIPGSVSSQFESSISDPEDQLAAAIELLMPLKDIILGAHDGNHPHRTTAATGLKPEKMIAKALGVPFFGHQNLWKISVNGIVYKVFSYHGVGSGSTPGGRLTKLMSMTRIADADLYLSGHIHDRVAHIGHQQSIENNRVVMRERGFASSASFLSYLDSYAERLMYSPGAMGETIVRLGAKEFAIKVSL